MNIDKLLLENTLYASSSLVDAAKKLGVSRVTIWNKMKKFSLKISDFPMGIMEDLSGERFGRLVVVHEILPRESYIRYKCVCDCGVEVSILKGNLKNGTTNSCGCLLTETSKENIKKSHQARVRYLPQDLSSQRAWERNYRDGDLSLEDFRILSQCMCYYCGASPSNIANWYKGDKRSSQSRIDAANFVYNGLDRIDNSKLHIKNNVVTCCYSCNKAKMEMTLNDFRNHIVKVLLNRESIYDGYLTNVKSTNLVGKQFPTAIKVGNKKYLPEISTGRALWINAGYKKEGLSFEEFYELSQMLCTYCGVNPSNSFNPPSMKKDIPFIYNGIDRLNSSKGHTLDNIVPACWNCNRMKSDRSLADFDNWLTAINNHWLSKGIS
jgi:5-methylcytosine-specific restriction endonuclease McrA